MTTSAVSAPSEQVTALGRASARSAAALPGGRGDDDGIERLATDVVPSVPPTVSPLDAVDRCRGADAAAGARDCIGRRGDELGQPTAWRGEDRAGRRGARPTPAATARRQQEAALTRREFVQLWHLARG